MPLAPVWHAVTAALLTLVVAFGGTHATTPTRLAAYEGRGSWVSIYDRAAWAHPERVVRRLAAHGIDTLFLETANDKQPHDVVRPRTVARFIAAAHAAGIRVVGWYLPSLATPRLDLRRALAGARFRTPEGDRFDSFALDLEATNVRSLARRSSRAVALAAGVRAGLPREAALGAITIDPVGATYWRGYPFRRLARVVDVFLPMEYFTARTHGPAAVRAYSNANVAAVRTLAGDPAFPVHPIGGEARHATVPELRAFLAASASAHVLGTSLWEYGETTPRQWATLEER